MDTESAIPKNDCPKFFPLEAGLHLLLIAAPWAFGSVYPWASMSEAAFLFFLFFLYPQAFFKIQGLPRFFSLGLLIVFAFVLLQYFLFSKNAYATGGELLKWLAFAAGFLLIQLLPRPSLMRLLMTLALVGALESAYGLFQTGTGKEWVLWEKKASHL